MTATAPSVKSDTNNRLPFGVVAQPPGLRANRNLGDDGVVGVAEE
jgi:hypothetical protein